MSKNKPASAVNPAEETIKPVEITADKPDELTKTAAEEGEQPAPDPEAELLAEPEKNPDPKPLAEPEQRPEPEPELARVLQIFELNGQKYRPDDLALLSVEEIAGLAASGFVDAHPDAVAYCQALGKTPV